MRLSVSGRELEFVSVPLIWGESTLDNLFEKKRNKTVGETIASKRYVNLSTQVRQNYPESLNERLGDFLFGLKARNDSFYSHFLNKYGDKTYCEFSVSSPKYGKLKGLYCFATGDNVQYIGRSHDPFEKRINQGYGHISPKNCYRDGQSTNCHLNSLIADKQESVTFYVYPLKDNKEIDDLEHQLIEQYCPEWNIALNPKDCTPRT